MSILSSVCCGSVCCYLSAIKLTKLWTVPCHHLHCWYLYLSPPFSHTPLSLFLPQVLFGTADGQVIVMDCHGRMLAHILLHESDGIISMSWNYPSFLVEDSSESDTDADDYSPPQGLKQPQLSQCKSLHR